MKNATANPDNKKFNVDITGSSNLTTTLDANCFAAKGHYHEISAKVSDSVPQILNSNGVAITSDADSDDTYLGVEKYTGTRLFSKERIFMNMVFKGDELVKSSETQPEHGHFFPLVFVDRSSKLTQDQVNKDFKPQHVSMIMKWFIFSMLLFLGLISTGLMICYSLKYRKLRKELYPDGVEDALLSDNKRSSGFNSESSQNAENQRMIKHKSNDGIVSGISVHFSGFEEAEESEQNSEDAFGESRPVMQQQARVFNLHGQGGSLEQL